MEAHNFSMVTSDASRSRGRGASNSNKGSFKINDGGDKGSKERGRQWRQRIKERRRNNMSKAWELGAKQSHGIDQMQTHQTCYSKGIDQSMSSPWYLLWCGGTN